MSNTWDKVIEVYKARLTIGLALLFGMVTLTGFGIKSNQAELFLIASLVPWFAFFIDINIKAHFACAFLYKALLTEGRSDEEPLVLLFLNFLLCRKSKIWCSIRHCR